MTGRADTAARDFGPAPARWLAPAIAGALALLMPLAHAQPQPARPAASAAPAAATAPATGEAARRSPSRPGPAWSDLTPAVRDTLAPLAASWSAISEVQKRKWVTMAQSFPSLSAAEQARMRSRMKEWVALSPAQRNQARLNFKEIKELSPQEKQARWEAYQKLSAEQKKQLAAHATAESRPPATAPATSLTARKKIADVPPTRTPRSATPAASAAVGASTALHNPGSAADTGAHAPAADHPPSTP